MKKAYILLPFFFLTILAVKTALGQTVINFESETSGDYGESPDVNTLTRSYSGYSFAAVGSQNGLYYGIDRDNPSQYNRLLQLAIIPIIFTWGC